MTAAKQRIAVIPASPYALVAGRHWPVAVSPEPGELLSSWLHRTAHGNGVPPRYFGAFLGATAENWSARLDRDLPDHLLQVLADHTGVAQDEIAALSLVPDPLVQLRLPLSPLPSAAPLAAFQPSWLQYCATCLSEDKNPFFRRTWTLAARVTCFKHGCRLRDRCPSCGCGVAPHRQDRLVPQQFCAFCGASLCKATGSSARTVRQIEMLIDDLLHLHASGHRAVGGRSIPDLLAASCFHSDVNPSAITRLSAKSRYHLYRDLAEGELSVLKQDSQCARYWTQIVQAAQSHRPLARSFAVGIDIWHEKRPQSQNLQAELTDLFHALAQLDARRTAAK